jgi:hypothetical protein
VYVINLETAEIEVVGEYPFISKTGEIGYCKFQYSI